MNLNTNTLRRMRHDRVRVTITQNLGYRAFSCRRIEYFFCLPNQHLLCWTFDSRSELLLTKQTWYAVIDDMWSDFGDTLSKRLKHNEWLSFTAIHISSQMCVTERICSVVCSRCINFDQNIGAFVMKTIFLRIDIYIFAVMLYCISIWCLLKMVTFMCTVQWFSGAIVIEVKPAMVHHRWRRHQEYQTLIRSDTTWRISYDTNHTVNHLHFQEGERKRERDTWIRFHCVALVEHRVRLVFTISQRYSVRVNSFHDTTNAR